MSRFPEPINVSDYERLAKEMLDVGPAGYYNGGAGDENTLRANAAAWSNFTLRPRVCVDVGDVSTTTTVLGEQLSMPILVAPTALQKMAHADGELAMARAADAAGTLMVCSTLASSSLAEIATAAPGARRWLQLYLCRDRSVSNALVDQAVAAGATAIAVTVDSPYVGIRERDPRSGFVVPDEIDMPGVTAVLGRSAGLTVEEFFSMVDPTLTWAKLEEFIEQAPLPVLVKGIQCGADARLACDHGVAGIVVSNHGGRQLDNVAPTAELLTEVVDAVGGRVEVLVDGGIRRGSDVCVAIALGASAVLVGRPTLWGLTVAGEAGATRVLELLARELQISLALLGVNSPSELTRSHVAGA